MNKINSLENSSFNIDINHNNEVNEKLEEKSIKHEKVLCDHCGRTANNGLRCLGICVADSDY